MNIEDYNGLIEEHGQPTADAAIGLALGLVGLVRQIRSDGYQEADSDPRSGSGMAGEQLHHDIYYVEKIVTIFEEAKAKAEADAGRTS